MTPPPDDDRAAILRRRAFFVSSALTATLGCSQERPPQPQPPVATVDAANSALPTAVATATAPEPKQDYPPLEVPDDVSSEARLHFENLARDVPIIHAELDAAARELSRRCAIEDLACDEHWEGVAHHLAKAESALADLGPRCPGSSEDAKRFDEVLGAHSAVIRARIEQVQRAVERQLSTDAAKERWKSYRGAAAIPRPCLRFACEDW